MSKIKLYSKRPVKKVYVQEGVMDFVHAGLDLAGLIPGYGEAADITNAITYAAQKDWKNAGLSLLSVIPVVGDALGKGGKLALYLEKLIAKGGRVANAAEILNKFRGAGTKLTDFLNSVKNKITPSAISGFFSTLGQKFKDTKVAQGIAEHIIPNLEKIKKMITGIGGIKSAIENVLKGLTSTGALQPERNQQGDLPATSGGTTAIAESAKKNKEITKREAVEIFKQIQKEMILEYKIRAIVDEEIAIYKKQLKLLIR